MAFDLSCFDGAHSNISRLANEESYEVAGFSELYSIIVAVWRRSGYSRSRYLLYSHRAATINIISVEESESRRSVVAMESRDAFEMDSPSFTGRFLRHTGPYQCPASSKPIWFVHPPVSFLFYIVCCTYCDHISRLEIVRRGVFNCTQGSRLRLLSHSTLSAYQPAMANPTILDSPLRNASSDGVRP